MAALKTLIHDEDEKTIGKKRVPRQDTKFQEDTNEIQDEAGRLYVSLQDKKQGLDELMQKSHQCQKLCNTLLQQLAFALHSLGGKVMDTFVTIVVCFVP